MAALLTVLLTVVGLERADETDLVLDLGGLGREEQSELLSTEVLWDSLNCRLAASPDLVPLEAVLALVGRAEADMSSLFSSMTRPRSWPWPWPPVIIMLVLQAVRGEAGTGGRSSGLLADLWDLMVPPLELSL